MEPQEEKRNVEISGQIITDRTKHPALIYDPELKPPYPGMIISISPKSEEVLPPITLRYKK